MSLNGGTSFEPLPKPSSAQLQDRTFPSLACVVFDDELLFSAGGIYDYYADADYSGTTSDTFFLNIGKTLRITNRCKMW